MPAKPKATSAEFNVAGHVLVPKHTLCSEKEKREALERFQVAEAQMPRILRTDAGIQHLSVKEGDLIKITRHSPTAGETTFYRIVIGE